MDLEAYRVAHGWPEIPTDPQDILDLFTQGVMPLDQDILLYLLLRWMETP